MQNQVNVARYKEHHHLPSTISISPSPSPPPSPVVITDDEEEEVVETLTDMEKCGLTSLQIGERMVAIRHQLLLLRNQLRPRAKPLNATLQKQMQEKVEVLTGEREFLKQTLRYRKITLALK